MSHDSKRTDRNSHRTVSRRKLLALSGASLTAVSGCLGGEENGGANGNDDPGTTNTTTQNKDDSDSDGTLDQVRLTLASENPADDIAGQAAYLFKENVEEKSDGQIIVDVVPGGAYGTAGELLELVSQGSIEATYATGAYFVYAQETNFPNHPWLFTSVEEMYEGWDLAWEPVTESMLDSGGIRPFGGPYYLGNRQVASNRRFTTPEESEGLDLRAPPLHPWEELLIESFGANTEPVALSEIYTAIDTGVVEAVELPLSDLVANSLHEVTDYLMLSSHSAYGTLFEMNEEFYQGLDDTHREIILQATDEIQDEVEQRARDFEEEAIGIFEEEGNAEIVEIERDSFQEGAIPVLEKQFKDPDGTWYDSPVDWEDILDIIN